MINKLRFICLFFALLFIGSFTACTEDDPIEPTLPQNQSHTLIIYMLGNNGLGSFMDSNLQQIAAAYSSVPEGNNIVVFYDRGSYTRLMRLYTNEFGQVKYDVFFDQASSAPTTTVEYTSNIFKMIREEVPSDSYGLIFSSHGGGWVPDEIFDLYFTLGNGSTASAKPHFIGQDGKNFLEVPELAEALKDQPLEYILFDACLMASVEALYELRHCTDWIIASSAEILGTGFPYKEAIPLLFQQGHGLEQICQAYMDLYKDSSGTISLIDCTKLDALAEAMKNALAAATQTPDVSKIQAYEAFFYHLFFDLEQYAEQLGDETALTAVRAALAEAVPYAGYTPKFYTNMGTAGYVDLPRSCGLTCHIEQPKCPKTHAAWLETAWAKAVEGK